MGDDVDKKNKNADSTISFAVVLCISSDKQLQ